MPLFRWGISELRCWECGGASCEMMDEGQEHLRMYRTYNIRQKYMKFEIIEYLRLTHSKSRCKEFERQLESYF